MKESDKLNEERTAVVRALEMENLSPEQRARGWKRFDELQEEIQEAYREEANGGIQHIRETLWRKK
ncbi:hypothetical protein [Cohnella lupini]|uniref:Uncharacterized protein n=1 Tax=Cohnella lupini TaxID=1294267 RepID=A0A3D9HZ31_9BACL|nr:hypothetical protein [Cohnella lupini]RED54772.1 hypothetical protein DFP95_12128 [Cohnella lupini]